MLLPLSSQYNPLLYSSLPARVTCLQYYIYELYIFVRREGGGGAGGLPHFFFVAQLLGFSRRPSGLESNLHIC